LDLVRPSSSFPCHSLVIEFFVFRENDITDVIHETFSTSEKQFGKIVCVDLKPGGADIPVTEANKEEYVNALVEYRIHRRVREQFEAFMEGLIDLIPTELINTFRERELEFLNGGVADTDMCVHPTIVISL
jgi:E3 ubiquitin-protein ligase NEDD4